MTDSLEDPITLLVLLVGVGGASGVCVGLCGGLLGEADLSDDLDDATTAPEDDASNITSAQAAAARERARMALFGVSLGGGAGAMAGLLASTLILSSHDSVNSRPALPTLLSALLLSPGAQALIADPAKRELILFALHDDPSMRPTAADLPHNASRARRTAA